MNQQDKQILERFKNLLREREIPLRKLVLFGSRARGGAVGESDYDVLVVVTHLDAQIRASISHCAWQAGFDESLVIVPVVVTVADIEQKPFRSSLLMQAIREEGITI
jgi:predicted nucleotidyltransferase